MGSTTIPQVAAGLSEGWKTSGEVATICGVKPYLLRKWRMRGDLPNAPVGTAGQGRGNELLWSPEAVAEAVARAAEHRTTGHRREYLINEGISHG